MCFGTFCHSFGNCFVKTAKAEEKQSQETMDQAVDPNEAAAWSIPLPTEGVEDDFCSICFFLGSKPFLSISKEAAILSI